MDKTVIADPKEELINLITQEMKRVKEQLSELKINIEQTQNVVDRERQRNSDISAELRTMDIETMPRQDMRSRYEEALQARSRLSTMQGQLEKFQSNRESLENQQTLLSQMLNKAQGADLLPSVADNTSSTPKAMMNIVRIVQAQEEERQRLARQMHDGPAQSLTNFILQAEICQRLFDRNPERAAEELDNLKTTASVTFQKVRDFIFDLRPMMLDDLGVVPTIRRYVDSFREKNDIETKRRLESHREVMLFRGIQELMGYARDYANAGHLSVKLDMSGSRIKAVVEDDGRGFDVEAAFMAQEGHNDPRAQGLITLREKFELIGGSVSVNSGENEGTIARLELPAEDEF
jgi:two-component system, NarL family, sensor histidine kinase DegS